VIECKTIAKLGEKERQQIKQYLRTTGIFKGYLVNFGNTLEVEYFT
jgi:GxxExxY protein